MTALRGILLVGLVLVAGIPAMAHVASAQREVHRRAGVAPMAVDRLEVTNAGLRVFASPNGLLQEQVIAWDRIAHVDPLTGGTYEAGLAKRLKIGEHLWRGRTRLLRGDARLARGEFESAWAQLQHEQSQAAALAAEGLLRASLLRQRPEDAMVAALAVAELKAAGYIADRFEQLPQILDETTGLIPELPPVLQESRVAEAAQEVSSWSAGSPIHDTTRAKLIRDILLRTPPATAPETRGEEDGVKFLRRILELDAEDPARRNRARELLQRDLQRAPVWRQAWIHFFVGRSLVEHETDPALRRIGVLELLYVPPMGEAAPRGLSARALKLAAETVHELGDSRTANILDSLLGSGQRTEVLETTQ